MVRPGWKRARLSSAAETTIESNWNEVCDNLCVINLLRVSLTRHSDKCVDRIG